MLVRKLAPPSCTRRFSCSQLPGGDISFYRNFPNNFIFWSLFWSPPPTARVGRGCVPRGRCGRGAGQPSGAGPPARLPVRRHPVQPNAVYHPSPVSRLPQCACPFHSPPKIPPPTRQRCTVRSTPSFLSLVFTYPHHLFLVSCFIPLSPPRMRCVMLQYHLTSTDIN